MRESIAMARFPSNISIHLSVCWYLGITLVLLLASCDCMTAADSSPAALTQLRPKGADVEQVLALLQCPVNPSRSSPAWVPLTFPTLVP
jgi:hypothetical protein